MGLFCIQKQGDNFDFVIDTSFVPTKWDLLGGYDSQENLLQVVTKRVAGKFV